MIGPEVGGCRPVIMTFRLYKDRDEVFRKAGMLRGSSLHISEDVTRKAKDSRTELRRFLRETKMKDKEAVCKLEYDRLVVNGKIFIWSDDIQAIVDTVENKVKYLRYANFNMFCLRLSMMQKVEHVMSLALQLGKCLGHLPEWVLETAQCLALAFCQEPTQS